MKKYEVHTKTIEWQGLGMAPSSALQYVVSVDGVEKYHLDEEDHGVTSEIEALAVAKRLEEGSEPQDEH